MTSTTSSDSDSDCSSSDEVDANVVKAFKAMQHCLQPIGGNNLVKMNTGNSSCPKPLIEKSSMHKLLYDTFKNKDLLEENINTENSTDHNQQIVSETVFPFFIDRDCQQKASASESTAATDLQDGPIRDIQTNNSCDNETNIVTNTSDISTSSKIKKKKNSEKPKKNSGQLSSSLQRNRSLEKVDINVDPSNIPSKQIITANKEHRKEPEIMKKSVITDNFEKQDAVATTQISVRQLKKQRKLEREKTKGNKWYNMPATEIDEHRRHDLEVLQMRRALDPKRFYKANDLKVAPKYFQFGKVVEHATDFFSSRIPKKQRKATLVEELLADAEFRKFNKRKYEEIQDAKRQGKGPYKNMKRLKKRK